MNKAELLSLLRESEDYISGQELCERFQVSRTAVWKVINQLKEDGYEIEAVKNRGYHLVLSPDALSKAEIESRLSSKWAGRNLYVYEETDSTNLRIKQLAEEGAPHGTLAVANKQTAGRGRRGRSWESPSGTSIYMSILLKPEFAPQKASMVTIVMAMAIAKAIEKVSGLEAKIKWPNDIVVNGKKVCGILTEMNAELDYIRYVVIGIGINVNNRSMSDFEESIQQNGSSLYIESGKEINRAVLVAAAMDAFEKYYSTFEQMGNLSGLLEEYNNCLISMGKEVKVLDPKGEFTGISEGINAEGELIVKLPEGNVTTIYAGEVSVRGLYGYV